MFSSLKSWFRLNKTTREELKKSKKEKRRCKKLYDDWEDNEYNCGPLKFIWGVKSYDDHTAVNVNFYSMNDIEIDYNRDTHKYLLSIETIYLFKSQQERINYLEKLLENFKNYLYENNLFNLAFDPHLLYLYNNGELFIADNLTELYYKFKIFVTGYKDL